MQGDKTSFATADDYALMDAIAAGHQQALGALFDRYAPVVLAVCRKILRDQPQAEEVLNDVFWEIWMRCDRYTSQRASPKTYLLMLARSRAIDRLRSERTHRDKTLLESQRTGDQPAPEHAASNQATPLSESESGELRRKVVEAMESLDPQRRKAVELSFFEGLSHSQIAQRLGQPLGTIKTRIRQGLIHLRDALGPYHLTEEPS